jgi:hypothetical protein
MRRVVASLLVVGGLALGAGPAMAAVSTSHERGDLVILSGDAVVAKGKVSGDVVIVHGRAAIRGTVDGSVVVIDGPVLVAGTVRGDVVSLSGPLRLVAGAHVKGDVWVPRGDERIEVGAAIDGRLRRGTPLRFLAPSTLITKLSVWAAISASTLALGLLLLLLGPRAADAVHGTFRERPGAAAAWGFGLFLGVPVVSILSIGTIVGIPFGVGLLLALAFLYSTGYVWSVWVVGRMLIGPGGRHGRRPRRYPAFLAGWAVMRAIGFVPVLGAVTWLAGAAFGLGLMAVATWRTRPAAAPSPPAWVPAEDRPGAT